MEEHYGRAVTKRHLNSPLNMKRIYTTQSLPEAGILRTILREHGIEAVIDNANAPIPAAAPPTILVADADEEAALRLIREHLGRNTT